MGDLQTCPSYTTGECNGIIGLSFSWWLWCSMYKSLFPSLGPNLFSFSAHHHLLKCFYDQWTCKEHDGIYMATRGLEKRTFNLHFIVQQQQFKVFFFFFGFLGEPNVGGLQILIIADIAAATTTVDTNQVVNPCAQLQPIKSGDAITVAVAIGGSSVLWYNNSDPLSNLLSPCSPSTATVSVTVPTLSNPSPNILFCQKMYKL